VQIFFTQVFKHSFFHADMHPGNVLRVDASTRKNRNTLHRLRHHWQPQQDFDQHYLARNLLAIFQQDYRG
jgi:ubiquinone biosynthesis protein